MTDSTVKVKILTILNLIGFLLMILVNFLANYLPINNKTTGELSGQYPNFFTPAGFTFSIWGIIYLLLSGFIVYQLLTAFRQVRPSDFIMKIRYWFLISCLANAGWIVAWHYERVILSLAIMLTLLFSLIIIYDILKIGRSSVSRSEKYLVHLPFSIYFAWINVATVANVTVSLIDSGWDQIGFSEQFWTFIILLVIIGLALYYLIKRRDIYFLLVILWAFFGILVKSIRELNQPDTGIEWLLIVGLILLCAIGIVQLIRKKVYV